MRDHDLPGEREADAAAVAPRREEGHEDPLPDIVGNARAVVRHLDHQTLNDFVKNPTTENMCVWIWRRLAEELPGLSEIELHETEKVSVIYRGE